MSGLKRPAAGWHGLALWFFGMALAASAASAQGLGSRLLPGTGSAAASAAEATPQPSSVDDWQDRLAAAQAEQQRLQAQPEGSEPLLAERQRASARRVDLLAARLAAVRAQAARGGADARAVPPVPTLGGAAALQRARSRQLRDQLDGLSAQQSALRLTLKSLDGEFESAVATRTAADAALRRERERFARFGGDDLGEPGTRPARVGHAAGAGRGTGTGAGRRHPPTGERPAGVAGRTRRPLAQRGRPRAGSAAPGRRRPEAAAAGDQRGRAQPGGRTRAPGRTAGATPGRRHRRRLRPGAGTGSAAADPGRAARTRSHRTRPGGALAQPAGGAWPPGPTSSGRRPWRWRWTAASSARRSGSAACRSRTRPWRPSCARSAGWCACCRPPTPRALAEQRVLETLVAQREMHFRLRDSLSRTEVLLSRSRADLGVSDRPDSLAGWAERLQVLASGWLAQIWNFELFSVTETTQIDGRVVTAGIRRHRRQEPRHAGAVRPRLLGVGLPVARAHRPGGAAPAPVAARWRACCAAGSARCSCWWC